MSWWVASLISNVCIIVIEYLNREADGTFWDVLPRTALPIGIAQFCLFQSFNGAPHWMMAWVVFILGNATMRVVMVQVTGQPISSWSLILAGVAIILGGSFVLKQGLN